MIPRNGPDFLTIVGETGAAGGWGAGTRFGLD